MGTTSSCWIRLSPPTNSQYACLPDCPRCGSPTGSNEFACRAQRACVSADHGSVQADPLLMRGCRGRHGRRKQRVAHAHRLRRKAKLRIALNLEVSVRLVLGMLLVNELGPIALVRDEALSRVLRAAGAGVSASAAASLAARHAAQRERSVCWAALHSYTTKLERRTSIRLSATPVARSKEEDGRRGPILLGPCAAIFIFGFFGGGCDLEASNGAKSMDQTSLGLGHDFRPTYSQTVRERFDLTS